MRLTHQHVRSRTSFNSDAAGSCRTHHLCLKSLGLGWLVHKRYVAKVHMFVHLFCNVVAEGFDLLANVFEEGVANRGRGVVVT